MKRILLLVVVMLAAVHAFAQEQKPAPDLKAEVIVDGKRFKVYNNWLSGGGGAGYNTQIPQMQFVGMLDYNFHLKEKYFQLGVMLAGDDFGNYNNSIMHAGYGKRMENEKFNFSAFGGLSYSKGYRKHSDNSYVPYESYKGAGLYLNAQAIKKITYDVGLGIGVTADVSKERTIAGITGVIYFSGAYKGKQY